MKKKKIEADNEIHISAEKLKTIPLINDKMPMRTYIVSISETRYADVKIEATSVRDAVGLAKFKYETGELEGKFQFPISNVYKVTSFDEE